MPDTTHIITEIKDNILNTYYFTNPEIRYYSRQEIIKLIIKYGDQLSAQESDPLKKYFVALRCSYLIKQVFTPDSSDYLRALTGICYLAPHIVANLIRTDALNVFLARDAAFDYLAAALLDKVGILPNTSIILYLSRKNLNIAYTLTRQCVVTHPGDTEILFESLKQLFLTNVAFRERVEYLQDLLVNSNVLQATKINFFDSWAEGTIFVLIKFAIVLYEHYDYQQGKLVPKLKVHIHELSFSVANPKNKLKVVKNYQDYINAKYNHGDYLIIPQYFYEYYEDIERKQEIVALSSAKRMVNKKKIEQWYAHAGVPFEDDVRVGDFQELMSAKIFKELNHFGSLNFGHPFEWDDATQKLLPSSPDKQIGSYIRQLLMINAVLGYKDGYKTPSSKKYIRHNIKYSNGMDYKVLKKIFGLSSLQAKFLESVMYENNEHFATCSTSSVKRLITNLLTTQRFLGFEYVSRVSTEQNYDFQYYINFLKNLTSTTYEDAMKTLVRIYGVKTVQKMFTLNLYFFIEEITRAKQLADIVVRNIRCVVLDIDGTLTPIDKNIVKASILLKKGMVVAFITGRPRSYCKRLLHIIQENLKNQYARYAENLYFYCSNGSTYFSGDRLDIMQLKKFSDSSVQRITQVLERYNMKIVSRRSYRCIAKKLNGPVNPNELYFIKNKIYTQLVKDLGTVGVYLINWHNTTNRHENRYNAIDICASSKEFALKHLENTLKIKHNVMLPSQVLVVGDEPDNSDKEIINNKDISVQGFGAIKTNAILKRLLF